MRHNDHRHHPAPKILPWLAHKAGIDEVRAEILWQAALKHADQTVAAGAANEPVSSDYWQAALAKLHELIAAEAQREDVASFGWRPWARTVACAWAARIEAIDKLALAPVRAWRILDHSGVTQRTPFAH